MDLGLKNKTALITGSSKGIGRGIAEALLREGARVCLCARSAGVLEQTRKELGADVAAIAADVSTEAGAQAAVAHVLKTFGRLDLLVNNVGGSRGSGSFEVATSESWRQVVDANLFAAVWTSRAAVQWMKSNGGGTILHISSIYGREYAPSAPTTAAKSALIALAKEMAVDLAKHQIRVNSVAPGSILFPGGTWEKRQQQEPEKIQKMIDETLPWKRFGRLEEVADVVAFIASPRASWVSGACIVIDGGQGRAF
ncbi:MAG: SDR family NAD(P)-dependent oxidoreductase [Myxococcaceae bacterium]